MQDWTAVVPAFAEALSARTRPKGVTVFHAEGRLDILEAIGPEGVPARIRLSHELDGRPFALENDHRVPRFPRHVRFPRDAAGAPGHAPAPTAEMARFAVAAMMLCWISLITRTCQWDFVFLCL